MKRVKAVRAGARAAMSVTTGSTLDIQGANHSDCGPNITCMSTQRWTVCELSGPNLSPSILSLLSGVKLLIFFHTAASETKLLPTVVVAILGSETTENFVM